MTKCAGCEGDIKENGPRAFDGDNHWHIVCLVTTMQEMIPELAKESEYEQLYEDLRSAFESASDLCHEIAVKNGWWDEPRSDGDLAALLHSEVSEWLEAMRNHNPESEKIEGFNQSEEELSDLLIRLFDMLGHNRTPPHILARAMIAKMKYNESRPYRHGGKAL